MLKERCNLQSPTFHVLVLVPPPLGLAESDAVDDRGVVELVRDDGVFLADQLLEDSGVGVKAAGVKDGILLAMEAGDLALNVLQESINGACTRC